MSEDEILDIFVRSGGFKSGHFVYVSGLHGDTYINKNAVYPYTHEISRLCKDIATRFVGKGVEVVVGPSTGGIILSQWVAYHLTELEGREVFAVYADKSADGFVIKRGYDELVKNKKCLVVEDLVTTGGSLHKVIEETRRVEGDVVGAAALVNRGAVTKEAIGNPPEFVVLLDVQLEQWSEADCELCKREIPVNVDVGHGKEFIERKKEK